MSSSLSILLQILAPWLNCYNYTVKYSILSQNVQINVFKRAFVAKKSCLKFLCPFAVYYLRYAVRSFFTMSRISLADGKRAGQKVQRKIAAAVQKVKSPLLFVPLF